ncbi:MAG: LysM peptidoglycan-binding domain-containing protein [Pseudolysinimonas sp.]|uniref:LysM peptidoglycan-binding domain-containing protein n=1 Tax=Pseudolysinimonas sp. TaxID=2680009 RepID=UPI003263440B
MTTVTLSSNTGVLGFSTRTATPRPAASRLRLTRRGRVVFTTIAAAPLVVLALFFGLNAGGAAATQDSSTHDSPAQYLTYLTVDGGQSLWDLAAEVAPNADPREFAAQIVALNQLTTSEIHPGQRLAIPAEYAH